MAYDKNNGTFKIRYEPKNQREKQAIEKEMARLISLEKLPNRKTVYGKGSGAANPTTSSKNVKGGDVKSPTGAEWEDCICYYYNNPAPRSSTDRGANKKDEAYPIASRFFGTQYEQQGRKLGKAFKGLLKDNTSMKPLGGGGKKVTRSLTSIYTKSGASNTIPKTDMYTGSYQIQFNEQSWYNGFGQQFAHADQHNMAFGNYDSSKKIYGNDGGIYFSQTNGSSEEISSRNFNYVTAQFYTIGVAPSEMFKDLNKQISGREILITIKSL